MTTHPPHEVNPICATCTQECKQGANIGLVACVNYEKAAEVKKKGKKSKA